MHDIGKLIKESNLIQIDNFIRELREGRANVYALCEAVRWSRVALIKEMLSSGVDPNLRKPDGITPLMLCSKRSIGELLLKHGAEVNAQDQNGRTPLVWFLCGAFRRNQATSYLTWLMNVGADPTLESNDGKNAIEMSKSRYGIDLPALIHRKTP